MDTSTGLIAVIVDNGTASPAQLRSTVEFVRSAPEIVRAVVASSRAAEIREAVSPAHAFDAAADELGTPPSFSLLSKISAWAQRIDGEPVRMVLSLDPLRPVEDPLVVYECLQRLITNGLADGLVGVRNSGDAQRWQLEGEWLRPVGSGGRYVEDPSLYVFRRELVDNQPADWRANGQFLPYEILPIHL